eukprot:TRINITY_DN101131_c0_g1_i1.p1 TRINITY_DN101131_c0_g1~~TRINITY_DN101131_c0_g1_i1.p1  ORF type:complete len:452 (+),score=84.31 TRINITY_DN101131_c0_g1_i1:77-1432(+)
MLRVVRCVAKVRHSAPVAARRSAPPLPLAAATASKSAARGLATATDASPAADHGDSQAEAAASMAGTDAMTTDATFRYRSFDWQTSSGESREYEYIVAQQPAGGETAKTLDARLALETELPRPLSGCSVVLIPSVSFICGGKEEMRPLAAGLSQRGHRCYILEWPGWSSDSQINYMLARCRPGDLALEYHDFWCQVLEHVAKTEAAECSKTPASGSSAHDAAQQICVVAAGHGSIYAMRALRELTDWHSTRGSDVAPALRLLKSMVMIAPSWSTQRSGLLSSLAPERASQLIGSLLHSESRLGRWVKKKHMSAKTFKQHFKHGGAPEAGHARASADFLFRRPRPFASTDGAALHGLLDPLEDATAFEAVAKEASACSALLEGGLLALLPDSSEQPLAAAMKEHAAGVRCSTVPSSSPLPHEIAATATLVALDNWLLSQGADPRSQSASIVE